MTLKYSVSCFVSRSVLILYHMTIQQWNYALCLLSFIKKNEIYPKYFGLVICFLIIHTLIVEYYHARHWTNHRSIWGSYIAQEIFGLCLPETGRNTSLNSGWRHLSMSNNCLQFWWPLVLEQDTAWCSVEDRLNHYKWEKCSWAGLHKWLIILSLLKAAREAERMTLLTES